MSSLKAGEIMAEVASMDVRIGANIKAFEDKMGKVTQKMERIGGKFKGIGKGFTAGVTVPLMAVGTAAFAAANDVDAAYNNIKVGTGATGDALEGLKEDFKVVFRDIPTDSDTASNALAGLNTMTGATGDTLQGLTKSVLEASRMLGEDGVSNANAFGSSLTQWGIPAEEGEVMLDKLFKATQDYGIGLGDLTSQLNKFGPTMQNAGFSMDESADLFGRLNKAGIDTSKVMPGLTKAFADWTGEGKDAKKELDGLVTRLQDGSASSEDFAEITTMFGDRAGNNFIAAVKSGMIPSLDELGDALQDTQGLVMETGEDTRTFGDRMNEMKNKVQLALVPLGESLLKVFEDLWPTVEKGLGYIQNLAEKFDGLSPKAKTVSLVIGGIAAAIGPLIFGIGTLMTSFTALLPIFNAIRIAMVALTGPVGIIIAIVGTLAYVIYKNWDDIKSWTISAFNAVGKFLSDFWQGTKDIFQTTVQWLNDKVNSAWSWLRDTTISIFNGLKNFFSEWGGLILAIITGPVGMIVYFVLKYWDDIKAGTEKVFQAVGAFFSSIWSSISNTFNTVVSTIVNFVKDRFEWAKTTISTIFTTVFTFYQTIWSKIWSVFSTVIATIVAYVKERFDWAKLTISTIFTTIYNFFVHTWSKIFTTFFNVILNIVNYIRDRFEWARTTITDIFTRVKDFLSSVWSTILSMVTGKVRDIYNSIRDRFNETLNKVKEVGTNIKNSISDTWNNAKNTTVNLVTELKDAAVDKFLDMVDWIKGLPERIGNGISSMKHFAMDGIKEFINYMGDSLETGVNKVVGGINTLLGAIGVGVKVPEISIPAYATGTDSHPGGPAIVGEKGRELAHIPGEGFTLVGQSGMELLNLPKGTSVMPNRQTERMLKEGGIPGYEGGKGWLSKAANWTKGKVQSGWDKAKDLGNKALEWIADSPGKLFDKAMELTGVSMPKGEDFAGGIMQGGFKKFKEAVIGIIKGAEEEMAPAEINFGRRFRKTSGYGYRTHPVTGQRGTFHGGVDYAAPTGTPIPSQSAGRVNFSGVMGGYGNLVRIIQGAMEYYYGHNSRNLVSVGQQVTKGQTIALVGSTGMSTGPHVHYETRRNGQRINPGSFTSRALGGRIPSDRWTVVGERGPELVELPASSYVHSNSQSNRMAMGLRDQVATSSYGTKEKQPVVVNVNVGSKRIARTLIKDINELQGEQTADKEMYQGEG